MLIPYIPRLQEDELLYSWLARLSLLNAHGEVRDWLRYLFGSENVVVAVDLPSRLQYLSDLLQEEFPFSSVDEAIEFGTTYAIHRPFIDLDRHGRIVSDLKGSDGRAIKVLLGRVANGFGADHGIHYCPECAMNDLAVAGHIYWHRSHNLPAINCCPTHGTRLRTYIRPGRSSHHQRLVAPPTMINASSGAAASPSEVRIAVLAEQIINLSLPPIPLLRRTSAYRAAACINGYAFANGQLDKRGLARGLIDFFDGFSGFEFKDRLLSTRRDPARWVYDLLERSDRALHPYCHLLLIDFLWGTATGFLAALQDEPQTGKKPTEISTKARSVISRELLESDLSCRRVSVRAGVSVGTVMSWRYRAGINVDRRRKSIQESCERSTIKLLCRGVSAPEVAQRMGISTSSVHRIKLREIKQLQEAKSRRQAIELTGNRNQWEALIREEKGAGIAHARRKGCAVYAWLYRNDRAWLLTTNERYRVCKKSSTRVDWKSRDEKLCKLISRYFEALKSIPNRSRISKSSLLRPFDATMINKNLHRMPQLANLLLALSESVEADQLRRIRNAIQEMRDLSIPLTKSGIGRKAGIKAWNPQFLKTVLDAMGRS